MEYIECEADGENAQPQVCQAAGIQSYPSWEIDSKVEPGRLSLEELAAVSNYEGPTNFQYALPTR